MDDAFIIHHPDTHAVKRRKLSNDKETIVQHENIEMTETVFSFFNSEPIEKKVFKMATEITFFHPTVLPCALYSNSPQRFTF